MIIMMMMVAMSMMMMIMIMIMMMMMKRKVVNKCFSIQGLVSLFISPHDIVDNPRQNFLLTWLEWKNQFCSVPSLGESVTSTRSRSRTIRQSLLFIFFFILFIYLLFFRSSIASSVFTEAHRNRIFFSWLFFFASFFFLQSLLRTFLRRHSNFSISIAKRETVVRRSRIDHLGSIFFFSFFFLGDRSTILAHWGQRNISKKKKKVHRVSSVLFIRVQGEGTRDR